MRRFALMAMGVAGVVAAVGVLGCGSKSAPTTPASPATSAAKTPDSGDADQGDQASHEGHEEHEGHEGHEGGAMAKMKEGLAKLSDADREAAKKQHMCPVSGEMLGTMGEPIKLSAKGQDVWLCCDGCQESFEKDPDKYLAKLKK